MITIKKMMLDDLYLRLMIENIIFGIKLDSPAGIVLTS